MHDHQGFESFRRERNKRRMEGGPLRPLGQKASILREIEEAEAREVRNQQLSREVHEFFAEATRTAATIVTQVAETAEAEVQESVSSEMSDFLAETMRRVQQFVHLVQTTTPKGIAQQDVAANMLNIVGPVLDGFRFAGDPSTAEAHVGQDPFATELDFGTRDAADADDPDTGPQGSYWDGGGDPDDDAGDVPSPIEEHLVAEVLGPDTDPEQPAEEHPLAQWFGRLKQDDEALKLVLKLLVRADAMTKDEARAIYRAR